MSNRKALEVLDRCLRDLRKNTNTSLFGGVIVVLAGDFRQTLPDVTRGTPADQIDACLKSSPLWAHV